MELIIGFLIACAVGAVVFFDARKRGMNKWWWAVGVTASMFPILIVYFIVRKPEVKL